MLVEEFFDLARVDILPTADHHVLDPAFDHQIPVLVHSSEIAGVHPALSVNGFGRLVRLAPVTLHHRVAARAQLSDNAALHHIPGTRVHNPALQVRHGSAHSAGAV